jgi:hypothetical protein
MHNGGATTSRTSYLAVVQDDAILDHKGHLELATGKSKIGFVLVPQQVES